MNDNMEYYETVTDKARKYDELKHIFRAHDRAGICDYMTRRHLAGSVRESKAAA